MTIGSLFDAIVYRGLASKRRRAIATATPKLAWVQTASGQLCVHDSGGDAPAIVIATASPCVVASYAALIADLAPDFRVVCFDMPGFGFSAPSRRTTHYLGAGANTIVDLFEALDVQQATLVCSSINGLYALAASRRLTGRLSRLVLVQTPDRDGMLRWIDRITQPAIRQPLFGQFLNFVSRQRFPPLWFTVTVGERADRTRFAATARAALDGGACYCFASFVQAMLRQPPDETLLVAPEALPVAVVWGARDRTHRSSDPAAVTRYCPQATLHRFENAGHYPELEYPDAFCALLRTSQHPQHPDHQEERLIA